MIIAGRGAAPTAAPITARPAGNGWGLTAPCTMARTETRPVLNPARFVTRRRYATKTSSALKSRPANIGKRVQRLSARVETGLTADCTGLEISEDRDLLMTRPAFGGNLMATIICKEHRPQMSTVRPGVMRMGQRDDNRKGTIEDVKINFDKSKFRVRVLETVKQTKNLVDITEAHVLISGGRGVGNAEGFDMLRAMANTIGAEVSASRAMVDAGVLGHERQVGQTGKTVRPDLYFAMGISGAIQHLAGMEESEYIIAINKDKFAPIFNVADLGIVGDVRKIVPLLTEKLKR